MKIDGHCDPAADIAWPRFEGHDPETVIGEEIAGGLREVDPVTGRVVGLEYRHASAALPAESLPLLLPPNVAAAA